MAQKTEKKFAVCIRNDACEDLVLRKVYPVLPDRKAERDGYLRIIDETGEDYLYPRSYFVFVRLPAEVQKLVTSAL